MDEKELRKLAVRLWQNAYLLRSLPTWGSPEMMLAAEVCDKAALKIAKSIGLDYTDFGDETNQVPSV